MGRHKAESSRSLSPLPFPETSLNRPRTDCGVSFRTIATALGLFFAVTLYFHYLIDLHTKPLKQQIDALHGEVKMLRALLDPLIIDMKVSQTLLQKSNSQVPPITSIALSGAILWMHMIVTRQ
ncbi:hypothetical protein BDR26DRAFT_866097 [Obelidium mucronatum]|nr:hypothetical protein BDR26DRAFT_866097 [Obelidium mucronatum]